MFLVLVIVYTFCIIGLGKGTNWWFNDEIPNWVYFTFLQNIYMGIFNDAGNAWLNHTWTLGVEEQFYLILSFLIYFSPKKILILVLIVGIVLSPIFRYNTETVYGLSSYPFCRFDSLFGGVLIAVINNNELFLKFFNKSLNYFYTLSFILLGATFLMTIGKWQMPLYIVNSWFSVVYMMILLIVLNNKNNIFFKLAQINFFVNLGKYSYSIYLIHQVILGFCFLGIFQKLPQINSIQDLLTVLFCLFSSYFVARFLYFNFELKIMNWSRRYKY